MKKPVFFLLVFSLLSGNHLLAQNTQIEGYTFASDNRGYLPDVLLTLYNLETSLPLDSTMSDENGYFAFSPLPFRGVVVISAHKKMYYPTTDTIHVKGAGDPKKWFLKLEMIPKPAYTFDLTILEKKSDKKNVLGEGITGARIEVYNQTKEREELVLNEWSQPSFLVSFEKGNHYTIMIRKKGFLTKRIEAYVNIKGCVLCLDGLGNVKPGVTEVLSDGLQSGMFLADVVLEPVELDKTFEIKNIYYDYNSWKIRPDAAEQLDKVITLLKDNPGIKMELGSHTDSRGSRDYNLLLSQNRAEAAVAYILEAGMIEEDKIMAKGYGESKPVNHCQDGVECSESEHQDNRRTELRILGIENEDPLDKKSLMEIIQEEKLLQEVLNGEIIQIPLPTDSSGNK